jgi:hypothetical protein
VQFLIQATSTDGSITQALLDGLAGKAGLVEFGDQQVGEVLSGAADQPGPGTVVRWWALVDYLHSTLAAHPPLTNGQDTSLVLARPAGLRISGRTKEPTDTGGPAARERLSQFEFRSTDPNAMLTIEDLSGKRLAVGVGSIEGLLPAGAHVGVLVDPVGVDPRVTFELIEGRTSVVMLDPTEQADGFRITGEPALRWSSAAAQLAAATASIWSPGHRSFLLVGWSGEVERTRTDPGRTQEWADSVLPLGSEFGVLDGPEGGWWKAFGVSGPWCALRVGNRRISVPIAPDSVSAVAITSTHTSTALFDTTHPDPVQIAAQDRVQQYLAAGRLGAADLTSRLAVEADRRWPWGATAAVRRLIDGARRARDEGAYPAAENAAHSTLARSASDGLADPPHQFVAQVPPSDRHRLVGHGPWAVWLDWP